MPGDEEILPIKGDEKLLTDPVLIHNGRIYKRVDFGWEKDISAYLQRNKKILSRIFGEGSIFIPTERIIGKSSKIMTDALLLKTGRNRMEIWVVEVDMLRHGVNSHIKDQVLKMNEALKQVDPASLAFKIYEELRRNRYMFQKIREEVLGQRRDKEDLLPKIKEAVEKMSQNIILIIDKVNTDLLRAVEEIRKSRRNVELIILQRFVDIDRVDGDGSEIFLITPLRGSEAEKTRIDTKSLVKRRMDKYWNTTLKEVRRLGCETRRKEVKKTRYYIAVVEDRPILVMRKMRKKGGVEVWIDTELVDDETIRELSIPRRIVKTGRSKLFKKLLEERTWREAYNFTSKEVPIPRMLELLKRAIERVRRTGDAGAPQEPHQHVQQP